MSLPEPSFIDRDVVRVTQELISQYEEMTGKKLHPAQVERVLIDLIAYREMLLRIGVQEAAKQNLVEYAGFPMLDHLGELVGVKRLPARAARTTISFELSAAQTFDVLIPKGTEVATRDGEQIFATDGDSTVRAGQTAVDVTATAKTAGAGANGYLAGEAGALLSPIAYVRKAGNISTSIGGMDRESDDRLRRRIKEAPESFSNAGSKGAYRFHAMSAHQDIVDAAVTSPQPGSVNVYPLTLSGEPAQEILTLVNNVLNDEKVRPLTDQVGVLSPARVDYAITANVTLFGFANSATAQTEIQKRLDAYKADMKARLGRDIVRTQIITLINGVYGVYKVDLTTPANDVVLAESEWANCAGTTINIVGSVNG